MSTELETKLKELNDELELLTSMVRAERLTATLENRQCTDEQAERTHKVLDRCIALASVPQQDVGAGRSVPSEYVMSNVRPAVAWFAEQMEAALRRNDHKGGWAGMDHETLLMRCGDEMVELKHCWNLGNGAQVKGDKHIVSEAADVANFAMMIADNYGSRIGDARLAVPSPVGQAQQDSDVLGDAEGGPRAAGVPFAEDGGTGSSLAAPSPAIATEARQMMRGRADRAYCNYIDQMRRDECLGESAKFSTGKFGPKELAARVGKIGTVAVGLTTLWVVYQELKP